MSSLLLLGLLAGVPLLLLTLLRIKPLYIFTSIVTGYLWVEYLGEPADLMLRSLVHLSHPESVARIGLLLIPILITMFLMRKSLPASALPFQFFLLVANSLLIAVFIINQLPSGVQTSLYISNAGNIIRQSNDVLISGVAGLHLLVMWIMRPKHHRLKGKHKKH